MNLENQVAIVTGGAVGIGRAIAKRLAELGTIVMVNYNSSANKAQELVEELEAKGLKADCMQANIANFEDAKKLINHTFEKYNRIDILVNNAGITADNLIMRMAEEDFDRVIDVNLKGTWNCSKHVIRYMMKAKRGKIINISSIVGLVGNFGQSNYSASKAGIIGLTKSLAKEVGKRGINVNAVAPGFIQTKMTDSLPEDLKADVMKNIPLNRLGDVNEVANVVAFLSSDLSSYITGQVISVDGGMR